MSKTSAENGGGTGAFAVKDCALIAIATGTRAFTLNELRDGLRRIEEASIYSHFWGGLLEPRFEEREYNNDFASWAHHGLHDAKLAEQLAMVDPSGYRDLEELRSELVDVVEDRLDESEHLHWMRASEPFDFIRNQIVVFDTGRQLERPEELAERMRQLSTGSLFYHFVDARRRDADGVDDLRLWLSGFGDRYRPLCDRLAGVDPYFGSLSELRSELASIFEAELAGGAS